MSNDKKPASLLLDHSYDGIQEHDNPLPGWWSAIFVVTILFSIGYWYWFHAGGSGKTEAQTYQASLTEHEARRAEAAKKERVSERLLAEAVRDPEVVDRGAAVFAERCVTCHGPGGTGLVGPNLTDDRQLHGSSRMDVYLTVRDGVLTKGMQAWGTMLPPTDVVAAAAYAISLRGTMKPGKFAEGAPVGAFEAVP